MANMTFKANLLPNTNLGYNLGSSDLKWNIYGSITPAGTTAQFYRGDNTWSNEIISTGTTEPANNILRLSTTATIASGYQCGINHLVPNLTGSSNSNTILLTGVANNAGNQGYLGFHYVGAANNGNWVSLGIYGKDHLIKAFYTGYIATSGTTQFSNTTSWTAGTAIIGADGKDKGIIGYQNGNVNGVVFGAHSSACTAWAPVNLSGTQVNFRQQDTLVGKFLDGCLSLFPMTNNFREGIRLHCASNNWGDITLCGADNTGNTGTSANSWFIGNNNGNFHLTRNGSDEAGTASFKCVDNVWYFYTGSNGYKHYIDGNHSFFISRSVGSDAFGQCAIEIRETGLVGNAQSSMDYAPKLGFHWGQRCAGFIALNSSNWFDFKNQANNGYKGINVGGLTCYGSSISVRVPGVDASQANNNVTSTQYPTSFNILDDSGRILTRQECVLVANNGEIRSYWYVRNYNTSGSQLYQAGICLYGYKDGTRKAVSELQFYGAVWNDYAEYRQSNELEPGRCIVENGDGTLSRSVKRLQKGCEIVSDTFGFAIGETEKCKTPTAATGRVLAYLLESKEEAKKNIGQAVCSGPNGTVSIMTDEECRLWPQCIIGTISEIPNYKIWHAGTQTEDKNEEIQVNGRIWIRIR